MRVSLAGKLHNARAILQDYRILGEKLWCRFNASREDTLWYYAAVLDVFRRRSSSPLVDELARTLEDLSELIAHTKRSRDRMISSLSGPLADGVLRCRQESPLRRAVHSRPRSRASHHRVLPS